MTDVSKPNPEISSIKPVSREELERRRVEGVKESESLASELRMVGINISDPWDLVNWRGPPYPEAVPILVKHLQIPYSNRIREGIARSLAVKYAREAAWESILELYKCTPAPAEYKDQFKFGLAVALSAMAKPSDLDTITELYEQRTHGLSRAHFTHTLSRIKDQNVSSIFERNHNDLQLRPSIEQVYKLRNKRKKN
jgi:hypothetical protein